MFKTMDDVRKANRKLGHHWFEPQSMRFFRSRVGDTVYGGRYFISSEQFSAEARRLYTIREVRPAGDIATVGAFQGYESRGRALSEIRRLLVAGEPSN